MLRSSGEEPPLLPLREDSEDRGDDVTTHAGGPHKCSKEKNRQVRCSLPHPVAHLWRISVACRNSQLPVGGLGHRNKRLLVVPFNPWLIAMSAGHTCRRSAAFGSARRR